ncbi:MAG TPA: M14 family metallocarboxypeptidase [Opitutaceae bacterium]|nr:M14 family metallocarboxypeptidase [Opitutaceae bacterium]
MSAVKAAPVDPLALGARLESAGATAGFRSEPFGDSGGFPLFALTRHTRGPRPRIYVSAGIHGDEPGPPLALLSLIESGEFDGRAVWFICPMLNPQGLARGTRENASGTDQNRDYRHLASPEVRAHVRWLARQPNFDLAVCVHEDWESAGFYLYELNPDGRPSLADPMIAAASRVCAIDQSPTIEGREAKGGVIRPTFNPLEREKWPESIYLQVNHTRLSYTIETPSSLPLATRVEALRAALKAAFAAICAGTWA